MIRWVCSNYRPDLRLVFHAKQKTHMINTLKHIEYVTTTKKPQHHKVKIESKLRKYVEQSNVFRALSISLIHFRKRWK